MHDNVEEEKIKIYIPHINIFIKVGYDHETSVMISKIYAIICWIYNF